MFGVNGYVSRTQNGVTGYFMRDVHGDILKAYGEDNILLADYTYDAWGNGTKEEGSWGKENPIRYAGEYTDSESGMIYLRARYYAPELGRFITEDPIKDGVNWYAYCDSNPVMRVDPSGMDAEYVSILIEQYDAERVEDNYTDRYTVIRLNGVERRIYWDAENNDFASYNNNGSMMVDRGVFLDLFNVDYAQVEKEYTISPFDALSRNVVGNGVLSSVELPAIIFKTLTLSGTNTQISVKSGNYLSQYYYAEINGIIYTTDVRMRANKDNPAYIDVTSRVWKNDPRENRLARNKQEFIDYYISMGYIKIR